MKELLLVAMVALATVAHAESSGTVKLSGLIYGQATDITSPRSVAGKDANGLSSADITRIYLTGETTKDQWHAKITLEAATNGTSANNSNNAVFLKQAYIEYLNIKDLNLNVQGGQVPGSWIGFEEGVWERRYVSKTYPDLVAMVPSADKGVSVYGDIPKGYGTYNLQGLDGEGVTATDSVSGGAANSGAQGRQKDYSALLSLVPFPDQLKNLHVNGFFQQGTQGLVSTVPGQGLLPNRERNRTFFGAHYKTENYYVMYTYYVADTGSGTTFANAANSKSRGYSIHGSYNLPWYKLAPFVRYDRYDAGTLVDYSPRTIVMIGLEKKFNEMIRMSVTDQNTHSHSAQTGLTIDENQIGLFAQAKF